MGLFDSLHRRRASRPRGACTCAEHVGALLGLEIPARGGGDSQGPEPVRDVLAAVWVDEWQFGGEPPDPDELQDILEDLLPGFTHLLTVGDELVGHYDDSASLPLDEALKAQPGIRDVAWEDREVFHVKAPGMCAEGIMAATMRALLDPRVRLDRAATG